MAEQESNLAILFVDVIDGLRTHEPVSGAATAPDSGDCLSLLQQIAGESRGRVVKTTVDGAMYAFPDADSAVLAACEMQVRVHRSASAQASNISIRIGLHFGSQFTAGVVAQRMAVLAASGQIITTGETKALLAAQSRNAMRQQVLPARAKQETVTVYEILWQQDVDQTQMPGVRRSVAPDVDQTRLPAAPRSGVPEAAGPRLRLIHADREIVVDEKITMGRRNDHGIPLKDPAASRDHAFIVRRDDKFVIVDQSSHGTYIRLSNGHEFKLWRNEITLRGSGVFSFARRASEEGAELVSFWCESSNVVATQ